MDSAAPVAPDTAIYDDLRAQLQKSGPAAAIDELSRTLRQQQEYGKLFYSMLMKKRFEMGVSPIPTAGATEMSPKQQEEYENAVREACRTVGKLFLDAGNIPAAFEYLRMIGEPASVAEALETYSPGEEVDVQPVIEIAFHHGLNPKRGFDMVLDRYGICSAITFLSGGFSNQHTTEVRDHCIGRLVRSLHEQLFDRLKAAVEQQQGFAPSAKTIPDLIEGRDWLFAEDAYYTDTSHLSSVVQMSVDLTNESDLKLARELCAYGKKLSPTLQYPGHAPFDDTYIDVDRYLGVLLGNDVEAGLAHFRAKITADPDGPDALSAAVLVKLLVRLNRSADALEIATEFLALEDERALPCPGPFELATKLGDFESFAAAAQKRHDPVHFLAGLIAAKKE
jgi:hypothetical protein